MQPNLRPPFPRALETERAGTADVGRVLVCLAPSATLICAQIITRGQYPMCFSPTSCLFLV